MHTTGISKTYQLRLNWMILVDSRQLIEEEDTIYQFRQSQRETAPNLSQNNNPNFGQAVERESSELWNACTK